MKAIRKLNLPFILLLVFPVYFAYDLYTGKVFFSTNDFSGMYYPFRQWFLSRLINFEFPIWNPYWGAGHEAVIWATVPVDPYTILELLIGPRYAYFHLVQCMALVLAGYYVFRKLNFGSWGALLGSLFFFLSPLVTCWYFEFINTNTFIAHMLTFLFMVKWFETGKWRYAALIGWAVFIGMFGTKLEFWFFEIVFFILLSVIGYFVMKPEKPSIVLIFAPLLSMLIAVLAQSWQLNLLINALNNAGRLAGSHGLHNMLSPELYRNLYLSIGDADLFSIAFICLLIFTGLHSKIISHRRFLFATGIVASLLLEIWKFAFLRSFVHSPVLIGAMVASILVVRFYPAKYLLSAWLLFMLPAYYWCAPLVNYDELYLLKIAPAFFKGIWGFLIWMGCLQVHRSVIPRLAYVSVLMVLLLQAQGQIILSYLFGYLWIPGRDNYLMDFSFAVMAVFGTLTYFRLKPAVISLAPFIMVFSLYPNLYYTAPLEPVPNYANPLLNFKLPYDPFTGVPDLREAIKKKDFLPYRRFLDPDIEKRLPQNQGTFLLAHNGNATFYGSMGPSRYRDLINFYRYGITPRDNIAGYPSTYSDKTISRLPKLNTKGFSNNLIYYFTVWTIPPYDLDLLRLLGVSSIITRDDGIMPSLVHKLKLSDVAKYGEFNSADLSDTLPRSFLVLNVGQENFRDFMENMRPGIEMSENKTNLSSNSYVVEPATIIKYKPEYVQIRVKSSSGGYLVLTDVFHPYWSAVVDGIKEDIIPAFHAFRAVKITPGAHKVEFYCNVPYFKLAFLISFIFIALLLIFTFYSWNRNNAEQYAKCRL